MLRRIAFAVLLCGLTHASVAQTISAAPPLTPPVQPTDKIFIFRGNTPVNETDINTLFGGGVPPGTVPNNAALIAASPGAVANANGLIRLGYATPGDAPPLLYTPLTGGNCAFYGLTADNASCVNTPNGKAWKASFGPSIDWREFGASTTSSDNALVAQQALNAAFTLGRTLDICGPGTYKTGPLYFYPTPVNWCSHATVLQRIAAGPVMTLVDAVGHTFPQSAMMSMTLVKPTIDDNASLWTTQGGAGIVVSAVNNWKIDDPWIYNIPTRATPAPSVTGAPVGTFRYTDAQGTGWAENGGIVMLGSLELNTENGHLDGGFVGNFVTPINNSFTCAAQKGASGLVLSMPLPQAAVPLAAANPPNGNSFRNTEFDCNSIGVRNDYGSANDFDNIDTTFSSLAGVAIGTFGRVDLTVAGTASGTSTVGVTLLGTFGTETASYTGTGSAADAANGIVTSINGNAALTGAGITAGQYPNTASLWISWADEHSVGTTDVPFNINVCGSGTFPPCSGVLTIARFFSTAWNEINISASEQSTNGAINIGANVQNWTLRNPQQVTGSTPVVAANHGGQSGATNPQIFGNFGSNAVNWGTSKSTNFTTNCASDPQPYIVQTGGGPITATLGPTEGNGTTCRFVDNAGNWAVNPLTIVPPSSAWGVYTVNGQTSLKFAQAYGAVTLTLDHPNNNTASVPTVNSGGNWAAFGTVLVPFAPTDKSTAGLTYTVNDCGYTSLPGQMIVTCNLTWPTTADTNPASPSLPFAVAANQRAIGTFTYANGSPPTFGLAYSPIGGSRLLFESSGGSLLTNANLSGDQVQISVTYQTSP